METKNALVFLKKHKYVLVVVLVGVLLMNLPSGTNGDTSDSEVFESKFDIDKFESRIEKTLYECEGVGRAKVVLSVESGPESVYAKDAKKSQREQPEGVVVESDSDMKPSIMSEGAGKESPIKIKEMYPEFRGALVVCDGANDVNVRRIVIDSVSALTGLKSDSISVVKMKVSGGQ